jgi:glycine C-acetyltransferase
MSLEKLETILSQQLSKVDRQGTSKRNELIICGIKKATDGYGPRYFLTGQGGKAFLRMNSNSYLGLSLHPSVINAETEATELYGAGPGAVRFISGTYQPHKDLKKTG